MLEPRLAACFLDAAHHLLPLAKEIGDDDSGALTGKSGAVAAPIPEAAPVTIATLSCKRTARLQLRAHQVSLLDS